MHQFWNTIKKIGKIDAYDFKLDKKKCRVDTKVFREILQICPRLPNQDFVELLSEEDLLTFIKELGYSGKCDMLSTIQTDQMHQPWRTFAAVINRCISGKSTGLDRLRESLAQEDFMYQADNREISSARKECMPYPRFTKVIIDHFISKDNTISMRNRINLHTARDDSLLGALKFVSKTEDCQKYGALIPNGMINDDIKQSQAYKTYLNYATRKVPPKKARKFKKPASPKFKIVLASPKEPTQKGKRVKRLAKKATTALTTSVIIRDTPGKSVLKKKAPTKTNRGKGIELLSDVALIEEAQLKKTLRKSKRETHKLQASGSSKEANFESEGISEDENDDFNDEDNDGSNDDDSGNDDDGGNDAQDSEQTDSDDDENPSFTLKDYEEEEQDEEYVHTPEKDKSDDEEKMYEEEDDDVTNELYGDYHASKMKEAVDVVVRLQLNKLKEEAGAKNQEFFNQVDSTIKVIIKEQVKAQVSKIMPQIEKYVTESLGAEVLVRSTNQPQTSYVVATSLSEFELKKILIDKMDTNKSINRSDIQKNLYNALVEDEDPFARSDRGTKRKKSSKDAETLKGSKSKESKSFSSSKGTQSQPKSLGKSTQAEEPEFEATNTEMQHDQGNESGHIEDQPDNEVAPKHDWFQKPDKPPTPNRAWNKLKSVDFRPPQKWISTIDKARKPTRTFEELMGTPIDFSSYVMNHLKIDNLTQEILVGHAFNLLKGSCKSFVELEYHFEECYKAVNDRLDWHNLKGREYPFNLSKPLPLIKDQGRQVVPDDYFINNDLEYLKGRSLSSKYATSTIRTKAAKYDNIKGIEDMVPTLWSLVKVAYNKHAVWGTYHWVMRWYNCGYLEEIVVRRDDNVLYKFKESDFPRLNLYDIEDMLLLLVQKKLSNIDVDDRYDLGVALRMFTRRIIILNRVEDLQLGVESYQKKLNITRPETTRSNISRLTPYIAYKNPQGIIYQDKYKRNMLMRSDELYKFCDGTLSSVRRVLHDIASNLEMDYLPKRGSDTKVIHNDDGNPSRANIKQALGRFNTIAGNPVKEILLKLNLPYHRSILTDSKQRSIKLIPYEVLKLKNIKKDGYTRFQYQEQYEHVSPEVTRSQESKRSQDDDKRLCLVEDLKKAKDHIHIKSKIQAKA
ncbi:hypothetical protein Tco_1336509 [Tanacetum coccineum]